MSHVISSKTAIREPMTIPRYHGALSSKSLKMGEMYSLIGLVGRPVMRGGAGIAGCGEIHPHLLHLGSQGRVVFITRFDLAARVEDIAHFAAVAGTIDGGA